MRIQLNGKTETVRATTLAELVSERNLQDSSLVIEYNGKIVKQELWQNISLDQDDAVEMLSFVGGG